MSKNCNSESRSAVWIGYGLLLVTFIAKFVPFFPRMPGGSLDESWRFGINQAVAQGLVFGKEMIFTYGPYTAIYSHTYHPATDLMMVGGSLYLAITYWACFILLMNGSCRWGWLIAYCAVLLGVKHSPDALFFSFPLLAGLLTFKIVCTENGMISNKDYSPFLAVIFFAPLGLLPLIKGSILVLCGTVMLLCAIFFLVNKRSVLALVSLVAPIASMMFFWSAAGQAMINLPYYFINMVPIAASYTEAMSIVSYLEEIVPYIISSLFLLLAIALQKGLDKFQKTFLLSIFFVFLFVAFKGGFVRADSAHIFMASASIMLSALLLPFVLNSRIILPVILVSLISGHYINSQYSRISPRLFINNITLGYSSSWKGIKNRIIDKSWPESNFEKTLTALRNRESFPILPGTTDIYSYGQSYLIASGNTWSPRPILHSYSAYTPKLAEINRQHILGGRAPENIIFRVETIDNRIPAIEDGPSWPALLSNYYPTRMANNFLFLHKKVDRKELSEPIKLTSNTHSFGEIVNIPRSNQPIFVEIDIKPTFWGQILNILFKQDRLQISVELHNGERKEFRIIACMAKSGFLISPLIETTAEFVKLYGKNEDLETNQVKSFFISPEEGNTSHWNSIYTATFSEIARDSAVNLSEIEGSD